MRVRRMGSSERRGLIGRKSHFRHEVVTHPRVRLRYARVFLLTASSLRDRPLAQPEDRPGDHEPLDLARPLVDLRDLRVAVVALNRKLLGVPVSAEDLDRLARLPP